MSRGGYGGPLADCFGETAIAINDQQLNEKNYISTDDKDVGPQADDGEGQRDRILEVPRLLIFVTVRMYLFV